MDRDSIDNKFRNERGQFVKGYKASDLPIEYRLKKSEAQSNAMKLRDDYIADIVQENPYIYNSWRAIMFNEKGKKAGISDEWRNFKKFYVDVAPSYKKGLLFRRLDTTKPFSKENYMWCTKEQANALRSSTNWLEYNGETLTLKQLSQKYNVSLGGLAQRYYKREKKGYSIEEIIFGRRTKRKTKESKDITDPSVNIRAKASKMISAYKTHDRKKGLDICDIDINWMITNILSQRCVYCGDNYRIGCDRIDNNRGHIKSNVVPCCVECNAVRNNFFSYEEMKILGKTVAQIKYNRPQRVATQIDIQKATNPNYYPNNKKTYQYDLQGKLINEFSSAKEAAEYIGCLPKTMNEVCRTGGYKRNYKLKGFLWSYNKDFTIQ